VNPWRPSTLGEFVSVRHILLVGLTSLVIALIRYYHMHSLQTFNISQNPNMPNNTFLRTEQDLYLEGEYR